MTEAFKCDCCREFFEGDGQHRVLFEHKLDEVTMEIDERFDVCNECKAKINMFLHSGCKLSTGTCNECNHQKFDTKSNTHRCDYANLDLYIDSDMLNIATCKNFETFE